MGTSVPTPIPPRSLLQVPSSAEVLAGRHPLRDDLSQLRQSLRFDGWLRFAAGFDLSSAGSVGRSPGALTAAACAVVFYSSIAVECADCVGGLAFEEFLEALAHLDVDLLLPSPRRYVRRSVASSGERRSLACPLHHRHLLS